VALAAVAGVTSRLRLGTGVCLVIEHDPIALAKQVAKALGALPVITSASDALGLPPVDLIGRDWGWQIERRENLTKVAAAVVRGETPPTGD